VGALEHRSPVARAFNGLQRGTELIDMLSQREAAVHLSRPAGVAARLRTSLPSCAAYGYPFRCNNDRFNTPVSTIVSVQCFLIGGMPLMLTWVVLDFQRISS
jgi:hypothetical protein